MSIVDTNDSFIYMWYIWRFVGVHPYTKFKWLYNVYAILINFVADVVAPFSVFINVFFLRDLSLIISNLQISPTLIVATLKQLVVYFRMSTFFEVKVHISELDGRANRNEKEAQYLKGVIKQCHLITLVFAIAIFFSWASFAAPAFIKRSLVFEGWFPFDWDSSSTVYALVFAFQSVSCAFQCVQNITSDAYPSVYINVLMAHYHLLGMRVARIGTDASVTSEDNYKELKACVNDHKNIIRLFETIKPVISESVMIQFIITAFVLCVAIIKFLIFDRNTPQLFNTLLYVNGILFESFPACYSGNALMAETHNFTTAIYNCNWIDQSAEFRKSLVIFMQRSQKSNTILAGGLATISLQTFIGIIRFSFSIFTVLSQIQS